MGNAIEPTETEKKLADAIWDYLDKTLGRSGYGYSQLLEIITAHRAPQGDAAELAKAIQRWQVELYDVKEMRPLYTGEELLIHALNRWKEKQPWQSKFNAAQPGTGVNIQLPPDIDPDEIAAHEAWTSEQKRNDHP